jgi:DNA-binding IclR family transcriptional regulator
MKNKTFASLEKALDILTIFDINHRSFTAQEISQNLDIPLSTTYKYIDVLLKRGFLNRIADSKNIRLGLTILRLGSVCSAGFDLIDVAIPHMKSLLGQCGETILLTSVEGWNAICLERLETQRLIKLSMERGRTLPLHAGASSRILLAYQDDEFIDDYIQKHGLKGLTKKTITNQKKLRADLKLIRETGYATSNSEVDEGAKAISAPVFNHLGKLQAGLTIAGPADRIDRVKLSELVEMVKKEAENISRHLSC